MIKKNLAILFLILFISGCKDESTDPVVLRFEIQPLNTGSTYYYVDSAMNNNEWIVDQVRITVSGKTTLTGEPNSQGVAMWDVYKNDIFIRRNFLNLEETGLYHYAEINNDDTLSIRKLWVKYPVNVGEQFLEPRYTYLPQSGEYRFDGTWKWHCVSIDSQVKIQNGMTIFCHVFKAEPEAGTEVYLLYALNIGYTGWQVNRLGERTYRQILTDYELK